MPFSFIIEYNNTILKKGFIKKILIKCHFHKLHATILLLLLLYVTLKASRSINSIHVPELVFIYNVFMYQN